MVSIVHREGLPAVSVASRRQAAACCLQVLACERGQGEKGGPGGVHHSCGYQSLDHSPDPTFWLA